MRLRRPPLFLAKEGYRRRRLHDAARLIPVLGVFLFFLPVLWAPAQTATEDTAIDGLYLFGVWILLIVLAACLAPGLRRGVPPRTEREGEPAVGDEG